MFKTTVITSAKAHTLALIARRIDDKKIRDQFAQQDGTAVGLCEGSVLDIIEASDVAEKAADVVTCEIKGNCPQHLVCLGIFGTLSAVKAAVEAVESNRKA